MEVEGNDEAGLTRRNEKTDFIGTFGGGHETEAYFSPNGKGKIKNKK